MRVLGLDVGMKTIGVALSDELGLAAHPHSTIARRGTAADARAVAELVASAGASEVVIGIPYELSGAEGPRAKRVRVFLEALATETAAPIHEWDERFSTVAVERVLIAGSVRRADRKKVIDKQAAAYILQGWLDARRPSE